MGWSCRADAARVERAWEEGCRQQTGSSNVFLDANNVRCFYETSRREHRDGAITGTIWRYLPDGEHVRKAGSFRIEGDGTITRAPATLKRFAATVTADLARANKARANGGNVFVRPVAY